MTFRFDILIVFVVKASCLHSTLTYWISDPFLTCRWRHLTACSNWSLSKSIIGGVACRMTRNWLGEIVKRKSQLPTQHFRVGCRLLQYLGRLFVRRNHFKKRFSHIPPQFQFNGNFKQSAWVQNYFWSVQQQLKSFIHSRTNLSPFTKDFRVWETPIETSTIFQASSEEAVSHLD